MKYKRVDHIDGLRGIAAMTVVSHHFACAFFPSIIFGAAVLSHSPYERIIAVTPLNLFFAGNYAVCLFFVISGYVLSRKYFTVGYGVPLWELFWRRYVRLMVPVLGSFVLAYFLLTFHLFHNLDIVDETYSFLWLSGMYNYGSRILEVLWQGMVYVYIHVDGAKYNTVTWSVSYEFIGSLLVYTFLVLWGKHKKRIFGYAFLLLFFWNTYYLAFILGMIAADMEKVRPAYAQRFTNSYYMILGCIVALFLGSYPTFISSQNTMYSFMNIPMLSIPESAILYHTMGAFLLFLCVSHMPKLRVFLSTKRFLDLGRISFSLFLLHVIILCSVSSWIFALLTSSWEYHLRVIVTASLSFPIMIGCAYLYQKYVIEKAISWSMSRH